MVDQEQLARAMDWVVPPDTSPGAGSPAGVQRLLDLVATLPAPVAALYSEHLPTLAEADLADPTHPLAPLFVEHVLDVYYGSPDTGAWEDIGFKVKEP